MAITSHTTEEYTDFLASFLPVGKLYISKYTEGKNFRKLIAGFAPEAKRICDLFITFLNQLDPRTTDDFLEEWESALLIPDDCIPLADTKEERRQNIVLKLASLSVQTEEDFINLGAQFGFTVTISYDSCKLPFCLPHVLGSDYFLNNTVIISGDFFTDPEKAEIYECLVKKLIPATGNVVFNPC